MLTMQGRLRLNSTEIKRRVITLAAAVRAEFRMLKISEGMMDGVLCCDVCKGKTVV
jgi:hypothetical protein